MSNVSSSAINRYGLLVTLSVLAVMTSVELVRDACLPLSGDLCLEDCDCDGDVGSVSCDARNLTAVPRYSVCAHFDVQLLNLSANRISSLHRRACAVDDAADSTSCHAVLELLLAGNEMTEIDGSAFVGSLSSLRKLDVGGNRLRTLNASTFSELVDLEELRLGRNLLENVPGGLAANSTRLRVLDLSANRITAIAGGEFAGLVNLVRLDLSANQIAAIAGGEFAGLANLVRLDVSANPLVSLGDDAFNGLSQLASVNLAATRLARLPDSIFRDLANLTEVDLSACRFTTIGVRPFARFRSPDRLIAVHLGGNAFVCDCQLVELFRWLAVAAHASPDDDEDSKVLPVCKMTSRGTNVTVYELDAENMTCADGDDVAKSSERATVGYSVRTSSTSRDPLPYDPMLGWYTAAALSAMLIAFMLCVGMEKLKDELIDACDNRRKSRDERERQQGPLPEEKVEEDEDSATYDIVAEQSQQLPARSQEGAAKKKSSSSSNDSHLVLLDRERRDSSICRMEPNDFCSSDNNYVYLTVDGPETSVDDWSATTGDNVTNLNVTSPLPIDDGGGGGEDAEPSKNRHNRKIEIVDVHRDSAPTTLL